MARFIGFGVSFTGSVGALLALRVGSGVVAAVVYKLSELIVSCKWRALKLQILLIYCKLS
jgi:hypothetical protein